MTPFRGIGANTALRDAQSLHQLLVSVSRGEQALLPALARYERDMIDYGFQAVCDSLKDMERASMPRACWRGVLPRPCFRAVDGLPLLKSAFLGR
jgi:2-polyprenyl-6-methoxyphenol hydroxylase-like FAD-dependent oxidoreductase